MEIRGIRLTGRHKVRKVEITTIIIMRKIITINHTRVVDDKSEKG